MCICYTRISLNSYVLWIKHREVPREINLQDYTIFTPSESAFVLIISRFKCNRMHAYNQYAVGFSNLLFQFNFSIIEASNYISKIKIGQFRKSETINTYLLIKLNSLDSFIRWNEMFEHIHLIVTLSTPLFQRKFMRRLLHNQ